MRYFTLFIALLALAFFSCKDDILSPEEQLQEDIRIIRQYLTDNNLSTDSTASGLHYIITQEGFGSHPDQQDSVTVKYKGYLTDGSVFDQTDDGETAKFALSGLIAGWQEGIPLLKKGGKGTFLLPSVLGYGPYGSGPVEPNSVLIFDIELVDF
jgi:FKBP-type peptidyl-prolyl cis-trans isomerase FkpA